MAMLPKDSYNFTQHSGCIQLKQNLPICFFFPFFLSCVSNPSSIFILPDIFSQTPQPHFNHTHLLSSELSIPNRLTGLWQKILVDLLGAPGSSRACQTYIFLWDIKLLLIYLCSALYVAHIALSRVMNGMFLFICERDEFVKCQLRIWLEHYQKYHKSQEESLTSTEIIHVFLQKWIF